MFNVGCNNLRFHVDIILSKQINNSNTYDESMKTNQLNLYSRKTVQIVVLRTWAYSEMRLVGQILDFPVIIRHK